MIIQKLKSKLSFIKRYLPDSLKLKPVVILEDVLGNADYIKSYRALIQPETVILPSETEDDKEFLKICKCFNDGYFDRSEIYVCYFTSVYVHVGTGIVFTKDFKILTDNAFKHRYHENVVGYNTFVNGFKPFLQKKLHINKLSSCITGPDLMNNNYWHWFFDFMPRIFSLLLAEPSRHLTLLLPDSLLPFQKESLNYLLPQNFSVEYFPYNTWVKAENFVFASYVSRRYNGFLPPQYIEYVKNSIMNGFGLEPIHKPAERIYISRAKARYRRVLNEDQVLNCLERFGFKSYFLEELSFKEQVDLFHRAEIVVGPHGAGMGNTLFSGKIKVLVFYPTNCPTTFTFTQTKRLGQEHYFLTDNKRGYIGKDDDFEVDIIQLEHILTRKMGLQKYIS